MGFLKGEYDISLVVDFKGFFFVLEYVFVVDYFLRNFVVIFVFFFCKLSFKLFGLD